MQPNPIAEDLIPPFPRLRCGKLAMRSSPVGNLGGNDRPVEGRPPVTARRARRLSLPAEAVPDPAQAIDRLRRLLLRPRHEGAAGGRPDEQDGAGLVVEAAFAAFDV